MFAALGEIQFEVVGSPEAYESAAAYDFAEQKVIESKPQLQWVGDDLERLKFELVWHASFTNPAAQLALLRATGSEIEYLDSGCCGMAGPFGFEKEKFEVSQTIGERVLLPAVRASASTTVIVTDGFSCREQIAQNSDRRAVHFAEAICPEY